MAGAWPAKRCCGWEGRGRISHSCRHLKDHRITLASDTFVTPDLSSHFQSLHPIFMQSTTVHARTRDLASEINRLCHAQEDQKLAEIQQAHENANDQE